MKLAFEGFILIVKMIFVKNLDILGHVYFQLGCFVTEFVQIQSLHIQNTPCRNRS